MRILWAINVILAVVALMLISSIMVRWIFFTLVAGDVPAALK